MVAKLGKCIFLVQKGFQYQKGTMPCPKSKFSTFIGFLPRYWPNHESLVTIGQRISIQKFWSQKGFQYQKSTMPCPKSKISTFIKFLPRYWPNPESLVTIGQTDLSPQILVPKRFPVPKKVLCHAQNPNFQLSLGFYLDTDQMLKVWSLLDKRISLRKFWSQKGFQYLQGPKIKIGL